MSKSRWRRPVLILGSIALFVGVPLWIAQDQETIQLRSAVAADDPRSPAYVAALVGADLSRGNTYDVLTNGDQIFPPMLEAIENAKRRISFEAFVYETSEIGNRFTTALEGAARRGVQVYIVLDWFGASALEQTDVQRLKDAGCHVVYYNEASWYEFEEANYRTHRKILVVDGEIGFTGGAGVADHWLGNGQDADHWRDTHVRIRGPIVRILEGAFFKNYVESAGVIATPELDDAVPETGTEGSSIVVRSSSTGGSSDLKRLYLLLIASARLTIDVASPYFITDESTMWALGDAAARGVKIRILTEGDTTDAKSVKHASRAAYDQLLSLGIELYEFQPTMMHTKVLVVDGVWSTFGSANFDNRSFELNEELNIAVVNRDLGTRFLQDFQQDLQKSQRLDLDTWRMRSIAVRVFEQFWSAFGELF
jgi:cardiolipin synthase